MITETMQSQKNMSSAVPSMKGLPGQNKPFDINLYFKAVGIFFNDFFGKKVPDFFKNIGPKINNIGKWWSGLPQDEALAFGAIFLGFLFVIAGIVLFFIL